jgi:competence protein ComEA
MCRRIVVLITILITVFLLAFNIEFENIDLNKTIEVEVRGQVIEKTINLPIGSTFNDLLKEIELVDGYDISSYSLNQVLYNKQIIVIPKLKQYELISINSASINELCTLPGIGESTAEKIIEYRNNYGGFNSLEELKNISGIGEKKYEKIKELITL